MCEVLFISASARTGQSTGYALAKELIETIRNRDNNLSITYRALGEGSVPPLTDDYETALAQRTSRDATVFNHSEELINELERSELLIIATPMHNFTVPASLKLWIDHVVRIGRTFEATPEGKIGLLADRPVYIIVSSGGFHQGIHARQADFLSPYLRHVLGTIGLLDVHFIYLEGQALGTESALAAKAAARCQLARLPLVQTTPG
jgi:FMN-dependent NADH-azoreductase